MATKFYLTALAAPYTPATLRGAWDDTAGAVTRALQTTKTGGGSITSVARAETNTSTTFDVLLYRGVSGPLAAQTISGTLDVVLGILESSASADFCFHVHVYVTQGDSDTPRGTILTDYVETTANEWPTTATGKGLASAQTLSSLAISSGDRLVVEIGLIARNNVATSFTGTLRYGTLDPTLLTEAADLSAGSTSVTTLAGFVAFSGAISENAATGRVSQVSPDLISSGAKEARISQISPEIVSSGAKAVRASQVMLEVLTPNSVSSQRVTQLVPEIVSGGTCEIRVSQLCVEVVRGPKLTTLKIKGRYSGGSGYRASSGGGMLTVKR